MDECERLHQILSNLPSYYFPLEKEKIVNSGLCLVNELYKEPFSKDGLKFFINKYVNL